MADKLHFNLVSPERELVSRDVDQVEIPGAEGLIGVLPNHAPLMTTLTPGMVKVRDGGDEKRIFVRGGFAEITPAGLTVLAEEAMRAEELNGEKLDAQIKNAEEDLADADTEEKRHAAQQSLEQLRQIRAAL